MKTRSYLRSIRLLILVFGLLPIFSAHSAEPFNVGYLASAKAVRDAQELRDITIAAEHLIGGILRHQDHFEPKFFQYQEPEKLIKELLSRRLRLVQLNPMDYVSLDESDQKKVQILSTIQMGDESLSTFVLLSQNGGSLESLSGKKLRIHGSRDMGLAKDWLDSVVRQKTKKSSEGFFDSVQSFPDLEEVIFSSFFGKADACLVTTDNYRVSMEMNPQIGKKLKPILTSAGFPLAVICCHRNENEETKSKILETTRSVHKTPKGRQAFDLIGVRKLIDFKPEHLNGSRILHEKLKNQTVKKIASGP